MTSAPSTPGDNPAGNLRRPARMSRRWFRSLILIAAVISLILMSQFSGRLLIVDSPHSVEDFAIIVDFSSEPCYRVAAERTMAGTIEGILLCVQERRRLVSLGALLPIDILGREKLERDGVAPDSIQVINGISHNDWDTARLIDAWLDEHRDKRVRVLSESFSSRRWSLILDRVLEKSRRSRVAVEGVVDSRFDGSNWWMQRFSIRLYFNELFRLVYARYHGEDPIPVTDWSTDKYEATVLQVRQ